MDQDKPGNTTPRDPQTPEEWQEAVNQAHVYLLLDSARQYGLIKINFEINIERCLSILERGKRLGYEPQESETD